MDLPHRQRPLAGVDQALGEGGARPPTELLEHLRERLARLDASHPSASRWPADQADAGVEHETSVVYEVTTGKEAQAGNEVEPIAAPASQPQTRPDSGQRGSEDPGEITGQTTVDGPSHSPLDPGPAGSADEVSDVGQVGGTGADWRRRPGSGDPYRPWFAADESVTPWFAE